MIILSMKIHPIELSNIIAIFMKHRKLKIKLGRNIGFKLPSSYVISQTFVGISSEVDSKGFWNMSIRRKYNVILFLSEGSCHLLHNIYLLLGKPQSFIVVKKVKTSLPFSHLDISVRIIVFLWNCYNRNGIQKWHLIQY